MPKHRLDRSPYVWVFEFRYWKRVVKAKFYVVRDFLEGL